MKSGTQKCHGYIDSLLYPIVLGIGDPQSETNLTMPVPNHVKNNLLPLLSRPFVGGPGGLSRHSHRASTAHDRSYDVELIRHSGHPEFK